MSTVNNPEESIPSQGPLKMAPTPVQSQSALGKAVNEVAMVIQQAAQETQTVSIVSQHQVVKASPSLKVADVAVAQALSDKKYKAILSSIYMLPAEEQQQILSQLPLAVLGAIKNEQLSLEETQKYSQTGKNIDRVFAFQATVAKLWNSDGVITEQEINKLSTLTQVTSDECETINELLKSSLNSTVRTMRSLLGTGFKLTQENWTQCVRAIKNGSFVQRSMEKQGTISDGEIDAFFHQHLTDKELLLARNVLKDSKNPSILSFKKYCEAVVEKQDPLTQKNMAEAAKGFSIWGDIVKGNGAEAGIEFILQQFNFQNKEVLELKDLLCKGSDDVSLLMKQKLSEETPASISMTTLRNAYAEALTTRKDWNLFASKSADEQVALLKKMVVCMKNYERQQDVKQVVVEKISSYYPHHLELKKIVSSLPVAWQPAINAKIIEYDLMHHAAADKQMLAEMRVIQPLSNKLATLFVTAMAASTDSSVQQVAAWHGFLKQHSTSGAPELLRLAMQYANDKKLLLPAIENQTPQQVLQAFFAALPQNEQAPKKVDALLKGLRDWNTIDQMDGKHFTDALTAIKSYSFSPALVTKFYEKLKSCAKNQWLTRVIIGYPLPHAAPTSMKQLQEVLEKGLKLYQDYHDLLYQGFQGILPKSAIEKVTIYQQVVGLCDAGPLKNELQDALRAVQLETGQLSVAEFDKLLQSPIFSIKEREKNITNFVRQRAEYKDIAERYKNLASQHSSWAQITCLKRAVQQRMRFASLAKGNDISLGDISVLLRSANNLSKKELQELRDIVTAKARAGGQVAKKIEIPRHLNAQEFRENVSAVVSAIIADKPITYQKVEQIKGVRLTNAQAYELSEAIHQAAALPDAEADIKAIDGLCITLVKHWHSMEKGDEYPENIIPLAFAIHRHLTRAAPVQHVADTVIFPFGNAQRRPIVTSDHAVAIFAKRKLSVLKGGGSFKDLLAALLITQSPVSTSFPTYRVEPIVRLASNRPENIGQLEEDAAFLAPFQKGLEAQQDPAIFAKRRLEVLHYTRVQGLAEVSILYDRCDAPIDAIKLNGEQQLSVMEDILQGLVKLHTGVPPKVHADVKPDNLLCTKNVDTGKAHGFLIDFNLSGTVASYASVKDVNYSTPEFTAPEREITPAADMFALGDAFFLMAHRDMSVPWSTAEVRGYKTPKGEDFRYSKEFIVMRDELAAYQREIHNETVRNLVGRVERGSGKNLSAEDIRDYITSKLLLADPKERWTAVKAHTTLKALREHRMA